MCVGKVTLLLFSSSSSGSGSSKGDSEDYTKRRSGVWYLSLFSVFTTTRSPEEFGIIFILGCLLLFIQKDVLDMTWFVLECEFCFLQMQTLRRWRFTCSWVQFRVEIHCFAISVCVYWWDSLGCGDYLVVLVCFRSVCEYFLCCQIGLFRLLLIFFLQYAGKVNFRSTHYSPILCCIWERPHLFCSENNKKP